MVDGGGFAREQIGQVMSGDESVALLEGGGRGRFDVVVVVEDSSAARGDSDVDGNVGFSSSLMNSLLLSLICAADVGGKRFSSSLICLLLLLRSYEGDDAGEVAAGG